jgi:thymidylate kinase
MGKLIVFEGIDGSGKSTQFQMICARLESEGRAFQKLSFPQYSEPSSALIRMYLAGEFGKNPDDVNAYAASTFYAVDRYASFRKVWGAYYSSGGLILTDRYTTSNAVHQASKVSDHMRKDFFRWLYEFEFDLMGLPAPDDVFYLTYRWKRPWSGCTAGRLRQIRRATSTRRISNTFQNAAGPEKKRPTITGGEKSRAKAAASSAVQTRFMKKFTVC